MHPDRVSSRPVCHSVHLKDPTHKNDSFTNWTSLDKSNTFLMTQDPLCYVLLQQLSVLHATIAPHRVSKAGKPRPPESLSCRSLFHAVFSNTLRQPQDTPLISLPPRAAPGTGLADFSPGKKTPCKRRLKHI